MPNAVEVRAHVDRPLRGSAVVDLNRAVRWWPERSAHDMDVVLASGFAVGAWSDQQLIGFARAISDGRFHAYIEDVMVHPDYRRRGTASAMVERLLALVGDVDVVTLFSTAELVSLYLGAGFAPTRQIVLHRSRP